MNSTLFLKWIELFANYVPDSVTRLFELVYDGYSGHYNDDIVAKAIELKIIMVPLPANFTHLIQPLDIAF